MPLTDNPMLVDRLCAAIRRFRAGDDALLIHLVQAYQPGATTELDTEAAGRILIVRGPAASVGIDTHSDITACCAQVGLALFGQFWATLPFVQTAWKRLHAEARAEAKTRREARHTGKGAQ